ncbi:MAG: hypothetical protein GYA20_00175 [Chloroflexi bacterium]|jgi:hypothetical protein|nr:hypothetical protein [Chloroflexota bacterium]
MIETLEVQLQKWRKILLVFLGAGATLFLMALVDFPARMATLRQDGNTLVDGWFGIWFLLLIASLTPAILLLMPRWRKSQLEQRAATGYGFLGVAWLLMAGFSLRMNVLLPAIGHFIFLTWGPLLAVILLLLRRTPQRKEEMFS